MRSAGFFPRRACRRTFQYRQKIISRLCFGHMRPFYANHGPRDAQPRRFGTARRNADRQLTRQPESRARNPGIYTAAHTARRRGAARRSGGMRDYVIIFPNYAASYDLAQYRMLL